MQKLLFTIGIVLTLLAFTAGIFAQPPRGGRGMGRGQRPQPSAQPQPQPAEQPTEPTEETAAEPETTEEPEVIDFQKSLTLGTVPDLTPPQGSILPLEVADLIKSQGSVPVIPSKAVKYATKIFEKYDANENGQLERNEWLNMPAAPQQIDIDGDSIISLEEFLRYFARYGLRRTLHNPNPPEIPILQTATVSDFPTFKPLSAHLKPAKSANVAKNQESDGSDTLTEDHIDDMQIIGDKPQSEDETEIKTDTDSETEEGDTDGNENDNEMSDDELDNLSYEQIIAGKFKPLEKKYYRPLSELRGVPAWFVRLDKDGDGQLTLIEFDPTLSTQGLATFGRLDKNGDGVITSEEMREALSTQ